MLHHNLNELWETGLLRIPSQFSLCLSRITQQLINFGRTEIFGVDLNQCFACSFVVTLLIYAVTSPFQFNTYFLEGKGSELANSMVFTSGNDEIVGLWLL